MSNEHEHCFQCGCFIIRELVINSLGLSNKLVKKVNLGQKIIEATFVFQCRISFVILHTPTFNAPNITT